MQTNEIRQGSASRRESPPPEPDRPPVHSENETLLHSLYLKLFDWPALSFIARAERATERYEKQLRRQFGADVPHRKLTAFKFVYAAALLFPETWEDIYAAGKAGCKEGQERKVATGQGAER